MATTSAPLSGEVSNLFLKNILVTTDFSDSSKKAIWQAAAIARLHGCALTVLHVVPPEPVVNSSLEPATWEFDSILAKAKQEMQQIKADEMLAGIQCHMNIVVGGLIAVVADTVQKHDMSMVVVGTHGRSGIGKMLLGSSAEEIFRVASCPVLTIGPDVPATNLSHGKFQSILFATDFSDGSRHALQYAIGFARESNAKLTLLHALDEGSVNVESLHSKLQRTALARLSEMLPEATKSQITTDVEVVSGYPVEEILRIARKNQSDLIVMGVHASHGMGTHAAAHLPWTIAHSVVCHAPCPVLTVRG